MEKLGKDKRGVAFRMGRKVARIWRKVVAGWKEITGEAWLERYQVLRGDLIRSGVERRKKIEEESFARWGVARKRMRTIQDEERRCRWRLSEFGRECERKWGPAARETRISEEFQKVRRENFWRSKARWEALGVVFDRAAEERFAKQWGVDLPLFREAEQKNRREEGGRRLVVGMGWNYFWELWESERQKSRLYLYGMWQRSQSNYFEGMSYMGRKELELAMGVAAVPSTWREEVDVTRESKNSGRNSIGPGEIWCERCGWTYEPGKGHLCMYPVRTFKGLGKPVTGRPAGAGW